MTELRSGVPAEKGRRARVCVLDFGSQCMCVVVRGKWEGRRK